MGYYPMTVAKWEIREYVKLVVPMIDFLKVKYRPFTEIAREAVRRGIIKRSEVDSFYHFFKRAEDSMYIFEREFYPYDQTPTGRSRWEWKLPEDVTKEKFMNRVNEYVKRHFKTPLYAR